MCGEEKTEQTSVEEAMTENNRKCDANRRSHGCLTQELMMAFDPELSKINKKNHENKKQTDFTGLLQQINSEFSDGQ